MAGSREILKSLLLTDRNNGMAYTAVAVSTDNQVTQGNIDNRSIGSRSLSAATHNTVKDGDIANVSIQSEPVNSTTLETVLRQTNPRKQLLDSGVVQQLVEKWSPSYSLSRL